MNCQTDVLKCTIHKTLISNQKWLNEILDATDTNREREKVNEVWK